MRFAAFLFFFFALLPVRTQPGRRAINAHTPAALSSEPPARLKRFCARGDDSSLRAEPANTAYSVALVAASTTKECPPACGLFLYFAEGSTRRPVHWGTLWVNG
jgi:hypothetical protein